MRILTQEFIALVQPTINPLFNTRQAQASLMSWSGLGEDYYSFVKNYWNKNILGSTSWNTALHDGVFTLISQRSLFHIKHLLSKPQLH